MELLARVKKVFDAESREYTKFDNVQALFHTRQMLLDNGVDELIAEVTGEQALQDASALVSDEMRVVQLRWRTRMYTDKEGKQRFASRAEIVGMTGTQFR